MSNNLSLMSGTLEVGSTENQLNEGSVENTRLEDKNTSEELAFSGDVATANGVPPGNTKAAWLFTFCSTPPTECSR